MRGENGEGGVYLELHRKRGREFFVCLLVYWSRTGNWQFRLHGSGAVIIRLYSRLFLHRLQGSGAEFFFFWLIFSAHLIIFLLFSKF